MTVVIYMYLCFFSIISSHALSLCCKLLSYIIRDCSILYLQLSSSIRSLDDKSDISKELTYNTVKADVWDGSMRFWYQTSDNFQWS